MEPPPPRTELTYTSFVLHIWGRKAAAASKKGGKGGEDRMEEKRRDRAF